MTANFHKKENTPEKITTLCSKEKNNMNKYSSTLCIILIFILQCNNPVDSEKLQISDMVGEWYEAGEGIYVDEPIFVEGLQNFITTDTIWLADSLIHEYIKFSDDSIWYYGIGSAGGSASYTLLSGSYKIENGILYGQNDKILVEKYSEGFLFKRDGYYGLSMSFFKRCKNGFPPDTWNGTSTKSKF